MWRIALCLTLGLGCRAGFDTTADPDAAVATDSTPVDAPPPPPLLTDCDPIEPILEMEPALPFSEPGMFIDHLTLLASSGGMVRQSSRADTASAFGAFELTTLIDPTVEDPTFIDATMADPPAGLVRMAADGAGPRSLRYCAGSDPGECEAITLLDEQGSPIADDVDGPHLAIIDGELVAIANRGSTAIIASPTTTDLLTWQARPLELGVLGVIDDPVVTLDGSIMVAEVGAMLFMLRYDPTTRGYGEATALFEANSPAIGVVTETELELFVTAVTRGIREVHRTVCRAP